MQPEKTDAELLRETNRDDPTGRLAAYMARTETPLDLLALMTLWIVVVPPPDFGDASDFAWAVRIGLSVLYGIDMLIRTVLAKRHLHYVRTHWFGLVVVVFPPLRVIFSVRLVTSVFRRGNLVRFLIAASVLVLNGALVVLLFERDATGSNIHTLREAVWWSIVTVTTVGYGDYYPITGGGQVAAAFIMAIGILTLAVVTAQVSSSFVDQAARRRATSPVPTPDTVPTSDAAPEIDAATVADLTQRLARIEALLTNQQRSD